MILVAYRFYSWICAHTKDLLIEKNGNKGHGDMLLLPHIECRKRIRYQLIINAHVNAVCAPLPIILARLIWEQQRALAKSLCSRTQWLTLLINTHTSVALTHAHVPIEAVCFIVLSLKYFPLDVYMWKINIISIRMRTVWYDVHFMWRH